jgi:O-antigen biosynthesis protein
MSILSDSQQAGAKPFISIIIPSYNGRRFLKECLPSVVQAIAQAPEATAEIIVVDDASADTTVEWLQEEWPSVKVVSMLSNSGFTRASNAGILASRGEWLGLLNNDTKVDKNWLSAALPEMTGKTAAIATMIYYTGERGIDSAGDCYTVIGTAIKRGHLRDSFTDDSSTLPLFSACAASAFYRRSALVTVGLFDEYLGAYYDDIDVGFRLRLAGFEINSAPGSICYHFGNASYGENEFRVWYQSSRNSEIVFWSNMPRRLLFKYGPSHIFFTLFQSITMIFSGHMGAYVLGKLAVVGAFPYILAKRKLTRQLLRVPAQELLRRMSTNWIRIHFARGFLNP